MGGAMQDMRIKTLNDVLTALKEILNPYQGETANDQAFQIFIDGVNHGFDEGLNAAIKAVYAMKEETWLR